MLLSIYVDIELTDSVVGPLERIEQAFQEIGLQKDVDASSNFGLRFHKDVTKDDLEGAVLELDREVQEIYTRYGAHGPFQIAVFD
ncbi:hypothetical protein EON80_00635 [bacterium]|nr:MAG: hypothetical protein EON80_00635 [bacterium]